MKYESSWTRPGLLGKSFLTEAISLKWKETKRDNPQTFETTHNGQKMKLEWYKGDSMKKGGTMHVSAWGLPGAQSKEAKEVANAVAKHFAGQRIITLNGRVFSTKVAGFKDRAPDDYTTYRPGWKKNWSFSA